jgi:hypothetical protein
MEDKERAWLWFWTIAIIVLLGFFLVWWRLRDTAPPPYATPPTYKIGEITQIPTSEPDNVDTQIKGK